MLRCFWEGKKDNVAERPVFRPHFPIQHPLFLYEAERVKDKLIRVIPWELIQQHEAQALKNHKRSLPSSSVDYAPARPSPSWKTGPGGGCQSKRHMIGWRRSWMPL